MSGQRWRARRMLGPLAVGVALGSAALVPLTSGPAAAGPGCSGATIEVTTNTDAALRAAFTTANGLAGPQTICIDSGLGTITLAGTELLYNNGVFGTPGLTVQGNGITISGNNASRVINSAGPLTLNGVTITGSNTSAGFGGAVFVGGNATLINSTVSGNTATTVGGVGGVFANGNMTLTNSTVSSNTAAGQGGLFANGNVTLINSTVAGNTATGATGEGGMFVNGIVTLTNSTVSGNTGANQGGVFANGNVTLTNSTVSGNSATAGAGDGGGMFVNGIVTLVYATVVQNAAPIGANVHAAVGFTSFGSVVAQASGGGANCVVTNPTSNGFNFTDDASAGVSCQFGAATDRVGTSNDPKLGALANNGGPTQTRLPQVGSPLIDAIPLTSCQAPSSDQRGVSRPQGTGCDIGAVEVAAPAPLVITPKFTG
jgi:hypothetical protein